jgi:hypothetical protein
MHAEFYFGVVLKVAALLRLVGGITAIEAPGVPLGLPQAVRYALAATYHGERAGIDPWELVAVARNESDFIEDKRGPDGKDCGLLQTRITVSRYTCRVLRHSPWIAFAEGARELSEFARSCKKRRDFDRCRLNRYNSGVRYAKTGFHGAYFLRVQCFEAAAKAGIVVGHRCRTVKSRADIARVLKNGRPRAQLST